MASDIKIFFAVLNSTLLPKRQNPVTQGSKGDGLNCGWLSPHHRNLTSTGISAGCPHCVFPRSRGAVTGQKYQYRLTGSLRDRLPQPAFRTDGYRFAPYLAVFDRSRKKRANRKVSDFAFLAACLQVVLAHPPGSLSLLGSVS